MKRAKSQGERAERRSEQRGPVPAAERSAPSLDDIFFALSDPIRRDILERLEQSPALVRDVAAPYAITMQSVSQHIQVLVRAGLVRQERSGRVSLCSIETEPMFAAAAWINRYTRHWDRQMQALGAHLVSTGTTDSPAKRKARRAGRE